MSATTPKVAIIMGSTSDWDTMQFADAMLLKFGIKAEVQIVSAHRTPQKLYQFAKAAGGRGIRVIIAGAGGAAHLPGMVASLTHVPVLGIPVESRTLRGLDSLLSINQMPAGIPVATFAIGEAGAKNAALFAISILAQEDRPMQRKLLSFRKKQTKAVLSSTIVRRVKRKKTAANRPKRRPSKK